jgi:hypothetical protein
MACFSSRAQITNSIDKSQIHLVGVYLFPKYPISYNIHAMKITAARRMMSTSKYEWSLSFSTISICLSMRLLMEMRVFLVMFERWDSRVDSYSVDGASGLRFGSPVETLRRVVSMGSVSFSELDIVLESRDF